MLPACWTSWFLNGQSQSGAQFDLRYIGSLRKPRKLSENADDSSIDVYVLVVKLIGQTDSVTWRRAGRVPVQAVKESRERFLADQLKIVVGLERNNWKFIRNVLHSSNKCCQSSHFTDDAFW